MKLELFNEDFVRIGKISKYSYASYDCDSVSYGKFLIKCASTEKLLAILPQVEYIYFENDKVGVYNHESIEVVGVDEEITLKGYMIKSVLSYRALYPQFSETLAPEAMIKTLVLQSFVENPNPEKNEPRMTVEAIPEEIESEEKLTLQVTGSDVFSECSKISKSEGVFFDFDVVMQNYDESNDQAANISELRFKTWKRRDRTIGNTEGNAPVVFSYSLSNIESSGFDESRENYKNIAIVAGEGEATTRAIEYVSDMPIKMEADENTLMLLHMDSLTDEVERTFTMTKGTTAVITNENTRFNGRNGFFKTEATTGYFQYTNPTLPAGDVTFEWWEFRTQPYSKTAYFPHVLCTGSTTSVYGARLGVENPNLEYLVCQIGTGNSSNNLVPTNTPMGNKIYNKWVHRAVVCEYTLNETDNKYYLQARFYENGKLFGVYDRPAGTNAGAKPWVIYKDANGLIGKYTGGYSAIMYIEEVRISNIARYHGDTYEIPTLPFNVKATTQYTRPSGLKRKELFVDARDLQSTDNRGKALSASEYKKLLLLRGLDKLNDYIVVRNVRAVTSSAGKQYVYGEDYKEGDIVTLMLEPIGVTIDIPIAMVTKTQQGSLRYTDIVFGDVKSFIRNQLRKENLL